MTEDDKVFYPLAADSEAEMEEWTNILTRAIASEMDDTDGEREVYWQGEEKCRVQWSLSISIKLAGLRKVSLFQHIGVFFFFASLSSWEDWQCPGWRAVEKSN